MFISVFTYIHSYKVTWKYSTNQLKKAKINVNNREIQGLDEYLYPIITAPSPTFHCRITIFLILWLFSNWARRAKSSTSKTVQSLISWYGSAYGANRFLQVFWYVIPFLICGISKYCRTGTNKTTQTNRPFFCGVPIKSPLLNNRAQTLLDFLNFTTAVSWESEQRNVILFKNLTLHTIPLCLPGTIFVKVESIYLNG